VADAGTGTGKVVVNRCMSLDGFIAGPGDSMNWIFDFIPGGTETQFPDVMAQTGAALIGRRTHDVGERMSDPDTDEPEPGYDAGALFVLTHRPPARPYPGITFLSGDVKEAVATALAAARGKNLEIIGADVAAQCLRAGLVDEIMIFVLPVLLGDGVRFYDGAGPDGAGRIDLEPLDTTRRGDISILRFRVRR
jgi:dihydrofolate reductase